MVADRKGASDPLGLRRLESGTLVFGHFGRPAPEADLRDASKLVDEQAERGRIEIDHPLDHSAKRFGLAAPDRLDRVHHGPGLLTRQRR